MPPHGYPASTALPNGQTAPTSASNAVTTADLFQDWNLQQADGADPLAFAQPSWSSTMARGVVATSLSIEQAPREAKPTDVTAHMPDTLRRSSVTAAAEHVAHELRKLGLLAPIRRIQGWIAMEHPELCPQWPALTTFLPRVRTALAKGSSPLLSRDRLKAFLLRMAHPDACGPTLLDFLVTHHVPVMQYLHFLVYGDIARFGRVRELNPTPECKSILRLKQIIGDHAAAIGECVQTMADEGFPTTERELQELLWLRGVRLSKDFTRSLPKLMASQPQSRCQLQRHGSHYFPSGREPEEFFHFQNESETLNLFRGRAPVYDSLPGADRPPREAGIAGELRRRFPDGFSTAQCEDVIAAMRPEMPPEQRVEQVDRLADHGLLMRGDDTEWVLNEAVLCPPAGRRKPVQPLVQNHVQPRAQTVQPAERQVQALGTASATQVEQVFTLLEQLKKEKRLDYYIVKNTAGRDCFDATRILQTIDQRKLPIVHRGVREMLSRIYPAQWETLLNRRQWERPAPTSAELGAQIDRLRQEIPYAAFAPRNQLVSWINERNPDFFCSVPILISHIASLPQNAEHNRSVIDAMVGDDTMALFAHSKGARGIDQGTLAAHLALSGRQVSRVNLDQMLARHGQPLRFPNIRFLGRATPTGEVAKHEAAARIMTRLQHQPGQGMPPWDDFLDAFHEEVCKDPDTGAMLQPTGIAVIDVYLALQRDLTPGELPLADDETSAPTARKRRKRPTDVGGSGAYEGMPKRKPTVTSVAPIAVSGQIASMPQTAPIQPWAPQAADAFVPPSGLPSAEVQQHPQAGMAPEMGDLHQLAYAMANAIQSTAPTDAVAQAWAQSATPDDALRIAQSYNASRTFDGQNADAGWTTLWLPPHQWPAVAGAVMPDLRQAVVMRSGQSAASAEFVALNHHDQVLYLLDERVGQPTIAGPDTAAGLTLQGGQFWAALPETACQGAVSRLVSWLRIPGFSDACDAIAELTDRPAPLDDFADWLDKSLGIPAHATHATAHQIRNRSYGMVSFNTMANYLAQRHGIALRPAGSAMPLLSGQDGGQAVLDDVLWRTAHSLQPVVALLSLPDLGRILALRWIDGMLYATTGAGAWPLASVLASAAGDAGRDQPVGFYPV
ncbi:hypothetical protein [Xylophilus sp. GOD-11R]|uniref:hypothetical protein n=1 Tax=Xylophilus sp. GOD-11R TaxID=3089814 RepID=UPI00298CB7D2|nr:hypothetical protein [Xylophilus sp. GOD-11R]WPB58282.1 hypothetical protein R9X41_06470 [Xylophilus sp. GOD-11R]